MIIIKAASFQKIVPSLKYMWLLKEYWVTLKISLFKRYIPPTGLYSFLLLHIRSSTLYSAKPKSTLICIVNTNPTSQNSYF